MTNAALYVNSINIQMNELALIEFKLNNHTGINTVVMLAFNYDFLKQMHEAIGQCIEQHEAKVHQLNRDKLKAN
jgi:hypothetical protein